MQRTLVQDPIDTGRFDIRFRIAMPVEVRRGYGWKSLTTEDVSSGGLFLRDRAPPNLRQLVRIRTNLPFSLGAFQANGVVTRRIRAGSARHVAGAGLAFFALGGQEREKWDRFIQQAAAKCPALAETPFRAQRIDVRPPIGAHRVPALEVSLGKLEDLFVLHSRDASRAGIFLHADTDFEPGQRIALHVVHSPSQSEFWIPCIVRRVARTRSRGIAVEFADDRPKLLRAFHEFLARLIDEAESQEVEA